ncbi:MAG: hypothetical protein LUG58_04805 [Clostridiales bacterium]|nr:hypothetical protein [Clostridiales bacterium]
MTPYLPRTVAIGDKLRLVPSVLAKQDNGNEHCQQPHALTGQVIYIHPKRRFATVRFPLTGYDSAGHQVDKGFCESWPIMPPERRLAHAEPKPEAVLGRPAGSRGKARPAIRQRLQERDWSGMTSGQIAAALDTDAHAVTSAIYALHKQGVDIPYKRRGAGGWSARKTAAGSTSSDSGKEK